jgi:redox-sensitive bicupin YhaK (pirin superfamily)
MLTLGGHEKDLGGGLRVRRLLPAAPRRAVGPFVFMDHFGPLDIAPGMNTDVRPHPHIGLATVTYLFEGAMQHQDSLGSVQRIEPGAINWMSAGRGIVHSERTPADLRTRNHRLHGLQLWVGLPTALEESAPAFSHTPAAQLGPFSEQGAQVRLLVGEAFGRLSPVRTASPTVFVAVELQAGTAFTLPALAPELAVYPLDGDVVIDGTPLPARTLGVLDENLGCRIEAAADCTVVVIGGAALDGPRFLLWNFVSSSRSRLQRAAEDWRDQRLGSVPGDSEFIPLPPTVLKPASE